MAGAGDSYEKILVADLQRAIDYLRFAEAKNAALVVLGSGWFIACLNLECSGRPIPAPFNHCVPLAMVFALAAALLALVSFLPSLDLSKFLGGKRAGPHPHNLLFFGDIASLQIKTLQAELRARYYPDDAGHRSEYIEDLTVQLSVNSEIAMRKMRLFSFGVGLVLIAALTLIIPSIFLAFHTMRTA